MTFRPTLAFFLGARLTSLASYVSCHMMTPLFAFQAIVGANRAAAVTLLLPKPLR